MQGNSSAQSSLDIGLVLQEWHELIEHNLHGRHTEHVTDVRECHGVEFTRLSTQLGDELYHHLHQLRDLAPQCLIDVCDDGADHVQCIDELLVHLRADLRTHQRTLERHGDQFPQPREGLEQRAAEHLCQGLQRVLCTAHTEPRLFDCRVVLVGLDFSALFLATALLLLVTLLALGAGHWSCSTGESGELVMTFRAECFDDILRDHRVGIGLATSTQQHELSECTT